MRLRIVIDGLPANDGIGPGKIDVLEDAGPGRAHREGPMAFEAMVGDDDDFAVLDLAEKFGADHVERACLGSQHVRRAEPADDQRADADRIARADHHVVGQADERVRAFDLPDRIDEAFDDAALLRARQKMKNDLGVGCRLTDGARGDEFATQRQRIGQVAVVGDGEAAGIDIAEEGLDVADKRIARGRVAIVADGHAAFEAGEDVGL